MTALSLSQLSIGGMFTIRSPQGHYTHQNAFNCIAQFCHDKYLQMELKLNNKPTEDLDGDPERDGQRERQPHLYCQAGVK